MSNMMEDWVECKLGDFIAVKGNSLNPKNYSSETFELYSVPNHSIKKPEVVKGQEIGSSKQIIGHNWVLLSRINPHLNRSWVVKSLSVLRKIASSEWVKFPPSKLLYPEYIGYYLTNTELKNYMCLNVSGVGGSLTRTNKNAIREYPLTLPPLPIQRAIVAKIERLFSSLDSGIADLKKAQMQLKIYRQAVLKKAFEGELTKEWREQQTDLPSAEELLEEIKVERQKHYDKQMEEWKEKVKIWDENGKEGKKPGKPKLIKELEEFKKDELNELPDLNSLWKWCKVDKIAGHQGNSLKAGPFGSSLKKEYYKPIGYKIYGQEQVISGDHSIGDYYVDEEKYISLLNCAIQPNDILISLVGTVGKVLILPQGCKPGIINPRLVKITPNEFYNSVFFKFYFESAFIKSIYRLKAHGATMDILNLSIIKELPYPFCSKKEQVQIIKEIESRLSVCDKVEESIQTSLKKAEALRQSILKKAFEGKLLTTAEIDKCKQEADYEPASVLLEKIKQEKTK